MCIRLHLDIYSEGFMYMCADIDYVMIKSEDDLEDLAQQKRKTYKYRVSE